jgi:antirestriction protein ArdC
MAKADMKQVVTDAIVSALEGGVAPWVKGWTGGAGQMPYNGESKRKYSGLNVLWLKMVASMKGYETHEWYTFKGAQKLGGTVRKGEKATSVFFTKWNEVRDENDELIKTYPIMLTYYVFNRAQIDGLPEAEQEAEMPEKDRHARADSLIKATGAEISYGSDRACYIPSLDSIQLPNIEQFTHESEFYSTSFHELAHWTGSEDRLSRNINNPFGSDAYAFEELVAELGAAFVCAELGVEGKLQHAEYIGSWIKVLRSDKTAIFRASALAAKAADYITAFESAEVEDAWEAFFERNAA